MSDVVTCLRRKKEVHAVKRTEGGTFGRKDTVYTKFNKIVREYLQRTLSF